MMLLRNLVVVVDILVFFFHKVHVSYGANRIVLYYYYHYFTSRWSDVCDVCDVDVGDVETRC